MGRKQCCGAGAGRCRAFIGGARPDPKLFTWSRSRKKNIWSRSRGKMVWLCNTGRKVLRVGISEFIESF